MIKFHTQTDFNNALYATLTSLEYNDLTQATVPTLVNGNVTIGVGYDLNAPGNRLLRDAVYRAIGVQIDEVNQSKNAGYQPPTGVTAAQVAAEASYVTRLDAA